MKPSPTLRILKGPDTGKIVPIQKGSFQIGRLPSCELVLSGEQISRAHAKIEKQGNEWVLIDLNSRNGVYVNGEKSERCTLLHGDEIELGDTCLQFELLSESKAEEPEAPSTSLQEDKPLDHAIKLFYTDLSPKQIAEQFLDIFFETFSPDRAQVDWQGTEHIQVARTREQGRDAKPFELPIQFLQGCSEVIHKIQDGRCILAAPLFCHKVCAGWIYGDRVGEDNTFQTEDPKILEPLAWVGSSALERISLIQKNQNQAERISRMEKYLTPEVVKMLSSQETQLDQSHLAVEEKEVTILFSDIQGFTSLSEQLSPSEVASLLNEYFQRMVDVIAFHHGEVNKFIGDAIMALFGAPRAYGGDAVNAVRAGLAMVEELKKFWEEIDERKRFNIRVGINTGQVVAGNIGSLKKMEYTVLGDEVNVASRLEGVSPANTVTIGYRTAQLVQKAFFLEGVPGVQVKGKSKAIDVFRVIKEK